MTNFSTPPPTLKVLRLHYFKAGVTHSSHTVCSAHAQRLCRHKCQYCDGCCGGYCISVSVCEGSQSSRSYTPEKSQWNSLGQSSGHLPNFSGFFCLYFNLFKFTWLKKSLIHKTVIKLHIAFVLERRNRFQFLFVSASVVFHVEDGVL